MHRVGSLLKRVYLTQVLSEPRVTKFNISWDAMEEVATLVTIGWLSVSGRSSRWEHDRGDVHARRCAQLESRAMFRSI